MNSSVMQDIRAIEQDVDYLYQRQDEVDLSMFDCKKPLFVKCDGEWLAVNGVRRDGVAFILDVGYHDEIKVDATGDTLEDILCGHCIYEVKGIKLGTFASLQQEYAAASAELRGVKTLLKETSSRKAQAFERLIDCAIREIVPDRRVGNIRIAAVDGGFVWIKNRLYPCLSSHFSTMTDRDFAIKYIIGKGK